ncbi:porin family protein [Arenibacter sp. M-2]|uniref:porin family protein n=1 Tax=unclassified Arenibacter TaxID=2615047 RepID=UPI000D75D08C|nr:MULTISPECIES: porin family protein [unclassified Arenibacter]MDL5514300.1 porin family protein [Arenibacter sp. M-2]PXX29711.1 outer membrane protein with beta-barrel domain [Arenibacter sp. ARW7G5Y1]|tara:strand:- start:175 stop:732 length:558 start_codon:yes stop_codon:yes gene_type:complete
MKKLLLLTALTVFGWANVNAQDIHLGAKVGINFASIYGDNTGSLDPITSLVNFGVVAEMPFSDKFSFQPEIMYSIQGYSIGEDVVALNYLNLPLMGKYYLTKGLSVEAGPQIGLLLSGKYEDVDVKDDFKTVDFGINLGLGYKLKNGLHFGARYDLGLSNINNVDGNSDKFRNAVLQVSVGYFFF